MQKKPERPNKPLLEDIFQPHKGTTRGIPGFQVDMLDKRFIREAKHAQKLQGKVRPQG